MDAPEPDTPFAAVSAQTTRFQRVSSSRDMRMALLYYHAKEHVMLMSFIQIYQSYLDKATPYVAYRWIGTGVIFLAFALRIVVAQGWYIGMHILPSIIIV